MRVIKKEEEMNISLCCIGTLQRARQYCSMLVLHWLANIIELAMQADAG